MQTRGMLLVAPHLLDRPRLREVSIVHVYQEGGEVSSGGDVCNVAHGQRDGEGSRYCHIARCRLHFKWRGGDLVKFTISVAIAIYHMIFT